MQFRVFKSITFLVGLLLFAGAFVAILLVANLLNPPPYQIAVARRDLEPYTVLTAQDIAVDQMRMSPTVARRLVHRYELERYVGHVVVEPIHKGEPLRRNALVSPENPLAPVHLSLALDDPGQVAVVVPVDAKTSPQQIFPGDHVDLVLSIPKGFFVEGSSGKSEKAAALPPVLPPGGPRSLLPAVPPPSPTVITSPYALTTTLPITSGPLLEGLPEVSPPFAKVVLRGVRVLSVQHKQVPNPAYGASFAQGGGSPSPYVQGPVESLTVVVPRDAQELIAFALDNGTVRVSLLSPVAVATEVLDRPTAGILWEDVRRFFEEERLRALGVLTTSVSTPPVTTTVGLSPTLSPSSRGQPTPLPPSASGVRPPAQGSQPASSTGQPPAATAVPKGTPSSGPADSSGGSGGRDMTAGLSALIIPVCVGGIFLAVVVGVLVVVVRRRSTGGGEW